MKQNVTPETPVALNETALLTILASLNFCHILDFMIIMPLGPQLMRAFGINSSQFGLLVSSYSFSAAASGLICALVIDRFDRKHALLFAFAGFILGTASCAIAPNYSLLLGARIIAGAFGGMIGAQIFSIIGDTIPQSRRGKATGIVMGAFALASVLGIPVSLQIALAYNWHTPFLAIVGVSVCGFVAALKFMPNLTAHLHSNQTKPQSNSLREIQMIVSNKSNQLGLLLSAFLLLAGFTVIPFISAFLVSNAQLNEQSLKYVYLCGGLATLVSSPLIGKIADKFGSKRVLGIVMMLSIAPVTIVTHLSVLPLAWILCATTSLFIVMNGRAVVAINLINSSVLPSHRGRFMSLNSSVQSASGGLATLIASRIISQAPGQPMQNYEVAGYVSIVFVVLCLVVSRRINAVQQD